MAYIRKLPISLRDVKSAADIFTGMGSAWTMAGLCSAIMIAASTQDNWVNEYPRGSLGGRRAGRVLLELAQGAGIEGAELLL